MDQAVFSRFSATVMAIRFEEFKFSFSNDLPSTLYIRKDMVVEKKKGNRDLIWLFHRYWAVAVAGDGFKGGWVCIYGLVQLEGMKI